MEKNKNDNYNNWIQQFAAAEAEAAWQKERKYYPPNVQNRKLPLYFDGFGFELDALYQ